MHSINIYILALQDELDSIFSTNTTISYKINTSLKEFQNHLSKVNNSGLAKSRIEAIQHVTLQQSFKDALYESSQTLDFHKNKRKEFLQKSLKTGRYG